MTIARLIGAENNEQAHSGAVERTNIIGDIRFAKELREVRDLKRFLFEEKVKFNPEQLGSIDLGPLNHLQYRPTGRPPTAQEWTLLDEKLSALASYLTDDLRQRIRIRELNVYFGAIPLGFLVVTTASIVLLLLYSSYFERSSKAFVTFYLVTLAIWALAQGGLGTCAFLGTRVAMRGAEGGKLSKALQEAADITDRNVLRIRILLGCLFGSIIGLPVSGLALQKVYALLFLDGTALVPSDLALIATPFMVGFSTNLVLAILDRLIVSIRTLLGITGGK